MELLYTTTFLNIPSAVHGTCYLFLCCLVVIFCIYYTLDSASSVCALDKVILLLLLARPKSVNKGKVVTVSYCNVAFCGALKLFEW
jgi:hypothetical protein